MAILTGVDETGTEAFYEIPDADLSKFQLKSAPLTDEARQRLFPGKDAPTKDDAHGVIPTAPSAGGDVEGFAPLCIYWVTDGDEIIYWYDVC